MRRRFGLVALFTAGVFASATLLFVVQPMTARGLLPLLGGSPAVWTTAMLFFQGTLLLGYLWAHWIASWRGRWAVGAHLAVIVVCGGLAVWRGWSHGVPGGGDPTLFLLAELSISVGPGFFALASAGPLLQRWFSRTSHPRASDPYFLYAASNAGSMLGLLGYPLLVEPALGLSAQRVSWLVGFGAAAALLGVCGSLAVRGDAGRADGAEAPPPPSGHRVAGDRWRWVFYAFVASSLMLGCTSFLSTDVAAFPLLWVVPLSVYLATFMVAFGVRGLPLRALSRANSVVLVAGCVTLLLGAKHPLWLVAGIHVALLGIGALLCHARLAAARPPAEHLTAFYLWISVGGAMGGVFNAIVAPLVFDGVAEYPITLALLAACGFATAKKGCWKRHAVWFGLGAAVSVALGFGVSAMLTGARPMSSRLVGLQMHAMAKTRCGLDTIISIRSY